MYSTFSKIILFNFLILPSKVIPYTPKTSRVVPDTDLAGYPANIFGGYPAK